MSDTPFRPFETALDRDLALKRLGEATAGADDGELFLERRRSEALVFDDGRVKSASYDASEGFGLRAVRGEVAGYAHSSDISEGALSRAVETARLAVGDGGGTMAAPPARTNTHLYTDDDPIAGASFPVKLETLREIDLPLKRPDALSFHPIHQLAQCLVNCLALGAELPQLECLGQQGIVDL